jgi:hypothetical protein
LRNQLLAMVILAAACENRETRALEELRAALDRAIAARKACADEPRCKNAQVVQARERARLAAALPPQVELSAFARRLTLAAGTRGLTLELAPADAPADDTRVGTVGFRLTVLGGDDEVAQAADLLLGDSHVIWVEAADRLTGQRRGWQLRAGLAYFAVAPPAVPAEADPAAAAGIAHARFSGRRAVWLRQSIGARGAELARLRAQTPDPARARAGEAWLVTWAGALAQALKRRRFDASAMALLRNRGARIDRIEVRQPVVTVEGEGSAANWAVVFGSRWRATSLPASDGRFRVGLRTAGP